MFNLSVIHGIGFLNNDMIVYGTVCQYRILHTSLTGVSERSLNASCVRIRHGVDYPFCCLGRFFGIDSRSLVV